MSLTRSLCAGDGKYDQFVACASPRGSPAYSTPAAVVNRSVAIAAEGESVAVGGLAPAVAAVVAMRVERGVRATRAALCSAQLALAEKGGRGRRVFPRAGEPRGAARRRRRNADARARGRRRRRRISRRFYSRRRRVPRRSPSVRRAFARDVRVLGGAVRGGDARGTARAARASPRARRGRRAGRVLGGGARGSVRRGGRRRRRRVGRIAAAAEALGADAFARGGSTANPSFFGGGERFGAARPAGLSLFGEDPGRGEGRAAAAAAAVGARGEAREPSSSPSRRASNSSWGSWPGTRGGSGPLSGTRCSGRSGYLRIRSGPPMRTAAPKADSRAAGTARAPRKSRPRRRRRRRTPQPRWRTFARRSRPRWRRWLRWTRRLGESASGGGPGGASSRGSGRTTGGSGRSCGGRGISCWRRAGLIRGGARTRGRPRCSWRGGRRGPGQGLWGGATRGSTDEIVRSCDRPREMRRALDAFF